MTAQLEVTRDVAIGTNSWVSAPIWVRANYSSNPAVRAQISFENRGCNAISLWLDLDGRLKTVNHGGNIAELAYTTNLATFDRVLFNGMAVVNNNNVIVGSYVIPTTGIYIVSMNQYFNYPHDAEITIRIALNGNYVAFNGDRTSLVRHRCTLNCMGVISASAGDSVDFRVQNSGTNILTTNNDPTASFGNVVKLRSY